MTTKRKMALGRGLSALLDRTEPEGYQDGKHFYAMEISNIEPGRFQPRGHFPEVELEDLAQSIQERGILQPILVREHSSKPGMFEIVAGERRWRAAQKAGLSSIPVIVKELSDFEALEVGLLENIQRQDLNPIEEAEGYRRLAEEFQYTQEALSQALGKSRSHIANSLRLLTLPKEIQKHLAEGRLSAGHARALIGADQAETLADQILQDNLTVRQTEDLAKGKTPSRKGAQQYEDPEKEVLREHLSNLLGVSVTLTLKGSGGKVVIPFESPTELDQLIQKLNAACS